MPKVTDCKTDKKYSKSVVHLVPHAGLKHREHVRGKAVAERMRTKSTRRHTEKINRRSKKEEESFHFG